MFTSIFSDLSVSATNVLLNVGTISDTNLDTILSDVKTRKANWYTDYDYLVYTTSSTYWTILLIPKVNVASFLFADVDNDGTFLNDIDNVYLMRYCSSANPCYAYRYTQSTKAFYTSFTYTTNLLNDDMTTSSWVLYYTNIIAKTQVAYYYDYCYLDCQDLITFNMEAVYNLKKIPTSILQGLGIVSQTEDPGFEKLILKFDTIFGDLELDLTWMKEAFASMILWLSSISSDLQLEFASLVVDVVDGIGDSISNWFTPNVDTVLTFTNSLSQFEEPLALIDNITQFYDELDKPGTRILPITGTVFGTEVSWDIKTMIFDPFLPVAPYMKNIFSFILWALFIPRLFKEVQTLVSGQLAS
jgi:hypothetical protein